MELVVAMIINKKSLLKKITLVVAIFVLTFWIVWPKYDCEYIYFNEGENIVTRIELSSIFGNRVFFTNKYCDEKKIPERYIEPKYSGFNSGFELIVTWKNDSCFFISYLDNFEIKRRVDDNFVFKSVSVEKFQVIKEDTTGRYNYQIERPLF